MAAAHRVQFAARMKNTRRTHRRLSLHRHTIRTLDRAELLAADGGRIFTTIITELTRMLSCDGGRCRTICKDDCGDYGCM